MGRHIRRGATALGGAAAEVRAHRRREGAHRAVSCEKGASGEPCADPRMQRNRARLRRGRDFRHPRVHGIPPTSLARSLADGLTRSCVCGIILSTRLHEPCLHLRPTRAAGKKEREREKKRVGKWKRRSRKGGSGSLAAQSLNARSGRARDPNAPFCRGGDNYAAAAAFIRTSA